MPTKRKLPKWYNVIPGGKTGDEEQRFFISLSRHPKFEWRSVSAIAKEANLSAERVEEIITKYNKMGMVVQHPKNEDNYGYWERVPDFIPDIPDSIAKSDQNDRITKALHSASGEFGRSCGSEKKKPPTQQQ
jgi:hypothetical protein